MSFSDGSAEWEGLGEWWISELKGDPAYETEVEPLALAILDPKPGSTVLDIGCGEGRMMRRLSESGCRCLGTDIAGDLLKSAGVVCVRAKLPLIDWLSDNSVDAALIVLVLEHIEDHFTLFGEIARVCRNGGRLGLVINHPFYTAPGSAPIADPDEILWRPGEYFSFGSSEEPAGSETVTFFHRTIGELFTSARRAGWILDECREFGLSERQMEEDPLLSGQEHFPRLLAVRWIRGD